MTFVSRGEPPRQRLDGTAHVGHDRKAEHVFGFVASAILDQRPEIRSRLPIIRLVHDPASVEVLDIRQQRDDPRGRGRLGCRERKAGFLVFRNTYGIPACNGYRNDGELIYQADHLITRANSATYADTRLIVCVCKGHHGWKNWHKPEYDALVKSVIGADRAALWERCEADSWRPHRAGAHDWKLAIVALKQELQALQ